MQDGRVKVWPTGLVVDRIDGWTDGQTDGRQVGDWVDSRPAAWADGSMNDRLPVGLANGPVGEQTNIQAERQIDIPMDGRMDG